LAGRRISSAPRRADGRSLLEPSPQPAANGEVVTSTAKLKPASCDRIDTVDSLHEHLQWAIELEHFTLPPYLCALYSLAAVRNPEASEVVASVLVEEMLHMTLAANLLNAVVNPHSSRRIRSSQTRSRYRLPTRRVVVPG